MKWTTTGLCLVACLVYIITALVSLNCVADGKNGCAQTSGFTALVFGCLGALAMGAAGWAWSQA